MVVSPLGFSWQSVVLVRIDLFGFVPSLSRPTGVGAQHYDCFRGSFASNIATGIRAESTPDRFFVVLSSCSLLRNLVDIEGRPIQSTESAASDRPPGCYKHTRLDGRYDGQVKDNIQRERAFHSICIGQELGARPTRQGIAIKSRQISEKYVALNGN